MILLTFYIILTLVFSAFFSGMEIAFVTSNRLRLEMEKQAGNLNSRIIGIVTAKPAQYIATMLIGNNISLVIYGICMAIALTPVILHFTTEDIWVLLIQTLISTLIILLTAEFLPKTLFRINPNAALKFFSIPVFIFYIIFYPFTVFTIFLSDKILKRVFNTPSYDDKKKTVFGKVDLDDLISESQSGSDNSEVDHELKIFQNALDFSDIKLRECMVPRNEIIAQELNTEMDILKNTFVESGISKILIYKESIDNIIGYVHSSELFKNPKSIRNILRTIPIVPETMTANKLLSIFIQQRKSIALVVDEFGGTSGIVTIEDIMEEIFGEIDDEYDIPELEEIKVEENKFIFSGRHEIDYLNEKYDLQIPDSYDYETLAGFIINQTENIPDINQTIEIPPFKFVIKSVSSTRIELVELEIVDN
ncbi:MAG: HlyC/CorC family transporter [Bacteroidales bacterium]|nr:HlyC/CorC family transporter [Bacteroidales bacterium]